MKNDDEIKEVVKEKYGEIARTSGASSSCSCCCSGGTAAPIYTTFCQGYSKKDGYVKDADLGLEEELEQDENVVFGPSQGHGFYLSFHHER